MEGLRARLDRFSLPTYGFSLYIKVYSSSYLQVLVLSLIHI